MVSVVSDPLEGPTRLSTSELVDAPRHLSLASVDLVKETMLNVFVDPYYRILLFQDASAVATPPITSILASDAGTVPAVLS